jgi:serralysin
MPEDVIKYCEDKVFTSEEKILEAANKAIEANPDNDPLRHTLPGVSPATLTATRSPSEIAFWTPKKWRTGQRLRVAFLDGDPRIQSKVKDYAQQWERYANINFEFGSDDSDAEIRIAFEVTPGRSWSWIGTDCLHPDLAGQPTMHYGWFTTETTEEEYSRVVLHEFGHALGCIHEHQHPEGGISWNKPAVYRYYEQSGWSKERVDTNIFDKYSRTETNFSAYDRSSIMHYAIPRELVLDPNDAVGWNRQLSPTDIQFVGRIYAF